MTFSCERHTHARGGIKLTPLPNLGNQRCQPSPVQKAFQQTSHGEAYPCAKPALGISASLISDQTKKVAMCFVKSAYFAVLQCDSAENFHPAQSWFIRCPDSLRLRRHSLEHLKDGLFESSRLLQSHQWLVLALPGSVQTCFILSPSFPNGWDMLK